MASAQTNLDLYRQASAALAKNTGFCRSGAGREALNQVEGLQQDFRVHLSWVMNLGKVEDTFSRMAVPNYLVRVLRPSSASLRLDFLLGMISECYLEVRGLVEQLARCFEADVRFSREREFHARLERLDSSRTDLEGLVENLDGSAGSFLEELGSGWARMKGPLTGLTGAGLAGGPVAFAVIDVDEVARLGQVVGRFRQLLSRVLEKWKEYQEK